MQRHLWIPQVGRQEVTAGAAGAELLPRVITLRSRNPSLRPSRVEHEHVGESNR